MSLEDKSKQLKDIVATYDTQWLLGDITSLMHAIADDRANDQLGKLSSPMRQLYFIAGLLVSSDAVDGGDFMYDKKKWAEIVQLLNEIEREYDKLFFPMNDLEIDEEWKRVRRVAMPSFLAYFNQGPLNYEEQTISWVSDLYSKMDETIYAQTGLHTADFLNFYNNLEKLLNTKFQAFTLRPELMNDEWLGYTKIKRAVAEGVPEELKKLMEPQRPMMTMMSDHGIVYRFKPEEVVSEELPIHKVAAVLAILSCKRDKSEFLYYTSTRPGNPLYENPIVEIGDGLFQVFEMKQVIHAIELALEQFCIKDKNSKIENKKGKLLETNIKNLLEHFFKTDYECYVGYYVDGCEQDILFLWKGVALIIEAKGYNLREPLRDPDRAFKRIKDDFKASIGYGYLQAKRVEAKFLAGIPFRLEDVDGNLIQLIDPANYTDKDYSIIVTQKSFGQIQNDLSTLLEISEDDVFPWAVRFDDLEVFLLTLIAQKKSPQFFIDFLALRENLHERLICSDELEVCAAYIQGLLSEKKIGKTKTIVTTNDLPGLFDEQYKRGMGFKNERLLEEKQSGKYIFF